jgi:hypothetical protein
MEPAASPNEASLEVALSYVESALEILDRWDAPADIGAHLDLALHRLRQVVGDRTY